MRYQEDRSSCNTFFIMICLVGVFISAGSLLGLRLYATSLESRVANTAAKIEKCKDQNALMERKCAMLLSPANVYNYAQEHLNMTIAEETPVVYVDAETVAVAKSGAQSVKTAEISAFERFNPFVNKAHAKD